MSILDCNERPARADSPSAHAQELGARLSQARQARGLERVIVAKQLAMSVRQVQEIEDGGASAFYSETHKTWAARKYASYLGVDWPGPG